MTLEDEISKQNQEELTNNNHKKQNIIQLVFQPGSLLWFALSSRKRNNLNLNEENNINYNNFFVTCAAAEIIRLVVYAGAAYCIINMLYHSPK